MKQFDIRVRIRLAELRRRTEMAGVTPSGAELHKALKNDAELKKAGIDVPRDARTVLEMLKKLKTDASGAWFVVTAEPDQAVAVAPVISELALSTMGPVAVTNDEARAIHAISRVAPDLPVKSVWFLTMQYVLDEDFHRWPFYDLFLAVQPWKSGARREKFDLMIKNALQLDHEERVLMKIIADSIENEIRNEARKAKGVNGARPRSKKR